MTNLLLQSISSQSAAVNWSFSGNVTNLGITFILLEMVLYVSDWMLHNISPQEPIIHLILFEVTHKEMPMKE